MHCEKCLNSELIPGVSIINGVCNMCLEYEKIRAQIENFDILGQVWKRKISEYRKSGKSSHYDAVIGISGGKDSAYVLYELIERYHLRVKALTFDNGFLSRQAHSNIQKIVQKLKVPHEYVGFNKTYLQEVYRRSIEMMGSPCMGCSFVMFAAIREYAIEHQIPLTVHGRSRSQIFSKIGVEKSTPFREFYESDLDFKEKSIRCFPNLYLENCPPYLGYFFFHEYKKDKIIKTLEEKVGWENGREHFDCLVHDAAYQMFLERYGYHQNQLEISQMIRSGIISLSEGKRILNEAVKQKNEEAEKVLKEFMEW